MELNEPALAPRANARPSAAAKIIGRIKSPLHPDNKYPVIGLLAVALIWSLAAIQWPLRDFVVPWDSKNQFYAFFRFMAEAIHEGSTPFWNPYHYAGHPSIADPQSLIFSPAFVLWALIDPRPSLYAFDLIVFAHLLIGGLAIVFLGRRWGWTTSGGVLAAAVFMLGGPVAGRLNHVGIITAYGLFPLAYLWMEIALDRRSFRAAAGFGFAAAMIILGRSQVPLLLCFVLAGLLVHKIVARPARLIYLRERLPVLCAAGFIALALVAVPMLLTMQFADFSNRPEIDPEQALRSSLYPLNFATFLAPNIFGSLEKLATGNWGPGYFTRPDVDSTDRAFNYLFAGSLPALLLIWHGMIGGRVLARGKRAFSAIALVSVLYAFGRYTPLFPFLFKHVPGIDLFRRPVGATFIFMIGLACLSGQLASDYAREGLPRMRPIALALGVASVAGLMAWALAFSSLSAKGMAAAWELFKTLPIYAALIPLLLLPASGRARSAAIALAVTLTAGELVWRNTAMPLNGEPRAYYAMLESPTGDAARIVDAIETDMRRHGDEGRRPRVEVVGLGGPWQNAAMVLGLETTNGYNPLRIGPYDRLVAPGETSFTPLQRRFPGSFPGYDCQLGRLLGLQYVVLDRPIEQMPNQRKRPIADVLMAGPKAWVYRMEHVAPRATIESRVQIADADEYIDEGKFPSNMPSTDVMVDSDDNLSQKYPASLAAKPGKADIVGWRPDRVEIKVDTAAPGILTLHDPWYPGWEVEVDGQSKPVLRTDILFRGVEIPAGRHTVVFAYRPLSAQNLLAAARTMFGAGE